MKGNVINLEVKKEDENLTQQVYVQIVTKVYHTMRYKVYQNLKNAQRKFKNRKSKTEIDYDEDLLGLTEEE